MSFTFSFSGDDIEADSNEEPTTRSTYTSPMGQTAADAAPTRAEQHKLEDLVRTTFQLVLSTSSL